MDDLVGKKLHASGRRWSVLTRTENNIAPHGVSERVDRPSRRRGLVVRMQPHLTEILTQTPFHLCTHSCIERSPGRTEDLVHNAARPGGGLGGYACNLGPKCLRLFFLAGRAPADVRWHVCGGDLRV